MFRLVTLGAVRLERDGDPVPLGTIQRKRLACLVLLAASGPGGISRDRLVTLLWPDSDAERARNSLKQTIFALRQTLGDTAITLGPTEVWLESSIVGSDVAEFAAAVAIRDDLAAARLYAGAFLDGAHLATSTEFEEWVDQQRGRFDAAFRSAVRNVALSAATRGDHVGAASSWRRIADVDPLDAAAARGFVEALERSGDRVGALRHLDVFGALVHQQLGVEPGDWVAATRARLRVELAAESSVPATVREDATNSRDADQSDAPLAEPTTARSLSLIRRPSEGVSATRTAARPRTSHRHAIAAGLTLTVGMVALVVGVQISSAPWARSGEDRSPPTAPDPRRIAVLYFDDHSADHRLASFADGLTERLIIELAGVSGLHVIPRQSVKPYRQRDVPFDRMATALAVGSIVEGSVERTGANVRVTVKLVDAASGTLIGSTAIERPTRRGIEGELASEFSAFVRRRLGDEVRLHVSGDGSHSSAARELALLAQRERRDAKELGSHPDSVDLASARQALGRADSLLALAEAKDPTWVAPTISRGWTWYELAALESGARQTRALTTAIAHADRALVTRPSNAAALELRGATTWKRALWAPGSSSAQQIDVAAAERDLRAALVRDSTSAGAWAILSQLLRNSGRFAEADIDARRALEVDAFLEGAADVINQLYRSAMMLGDHVTARSWCARGRRDVPYDWRLVECGLTLMRFDPPAAEPERAWTIVAELDRLDPPDRARAAGRIYSPMYRQLIAAAVSARAGQHTRATRVLADARAAAVQHPDIAIDMLYDEALVLLALGEREAAARTLARYVAARPQYREFAERDPALGALLKPRSLVPAG